MAKERVLIVGGGFGGVKAALELAASPKVAVTLLSDSPNFRYFPTTYHTATGGARDNSIIPLAGIIGDHPIRLVIGRAISLDRQQKAIITEDKQVLFFDRLILSLGMMTNYFGINGLDKYSYDIRSLSSLDKLKHHLHQQLLDNRQPDINYVIVGAGPTGIELAGALPEYVRHIMSRHGLKHRSIHIDLIEAKPRLLPQMPKSASRAVRRRLRRLGVKLYLGQSVQGVTADELTVNGRPIRSHTVIWTAGVTNHPFYAANDFNLTAHGKVATDIYLQADDNVYVIGDNANTPYSGMAQTALYDGRFVAQNILRQLNGRLPKAYKPKRSISVVPVGPHWAMVVFGRLRLYGWLGSVLRQAADVVGYADYEPWWQASRQWLTTFEHEEYCPLCGTPNVPD